MHEHFLVSASAESAIFHAPKLLIDQCCPVALTSFIEEMGLGTAYHVTELGLRDIKDRFLHDYATNMGFSAIVTLDSAESDALDICYYAAQRAEHAKDDPEQLSSLPMMVVLRYPSRVVKMAGTEQFKALTHLLRDQRDDIKEHIEKKDGSILTVMDPADRPDPAAFFDSRSRIPLAIAISERYTKKVPLERRTDELRELIAAFATDMALNRVL